MTPRRGRPRAGGPGDGSAEVVSIAALTGYQPGHARRACEEVAAARELLGMARAEYAGHLSAVLGWRVTSDNVANWEDGATPPGDVVKANDTILDGSAGGLASLLDPVPNALPASAIAGPWVTAYQFLHRGVPHYHADIAHLTAAGDRLIRAVNHPPEPRTQGRASPFRNQIEGHLFGRHLIGAWRNTSDTRYYGAFEMAVLPGETVMDGIYAGVASDIAVSCEHWRWVRLDDGDLAGVILGQPPALYELVMSRTQDDPPLTVDDIREEA